MVEWPTLAMIAGVLRCLARGRCFFLWPSYPMLALTVMTLMVALQSSLMHEASHGHPTRNAGLNEALVGLPIGLVWPYRRFRTLHLRHHADDRLTDPFDDPESYYRAMWQYRSLPAWLQALLRFNNTMVGRLVIGPLMANAGFLAGGAAADPSGRPPGGARLDQTISLASPWSCRSSCSCSRCRSGFMCWCRPGSASR